MVIKFLELARRRLRALYESVKSKGPQPWMLILSLLRLLIDLLWK